MEQIKRALKQFSIAKLDCMAIVYIDSLDFEVLLFCPCKATGGHRNADMATSPTNVVILCCRKQSRRSFSPLFKSCCFSLFCLLTGF